MDTIRNVNGKATPTYSTWQAMRKRCNNPNYKQYQDYGGRGLSVCTRWDDFEKFLKDMGEKPEGLTIERIDNDKGYYPGNCKWATRQEQAQNKRKYKLYAGRFINRVGKQYGFLTVTKLSERKNGRIMWECICSCGNTTIVDSTNLHNKGIKTCGCSKTKSGRAAS